MKRLGALGIVQLRIGLALLSGIAIGILLCAPLFPWVIPEGYSNVLGAGLGAALAVWASLYAVEISQHREERRLAGFIAEIVQPLVTAVRRLDSVLPEQPADDLSTEDLAPIRKEALAIIGAVEFCRERLARIEAISYRLSVMRLRALLDFEKGLRMADALAQEIDIKYSSTAARMYGGPVEIDFIERTSKVRSLLDCALQSFEK